MAFISTPMTASRFNSRQAKTCLTLLFVNAILVIGICVAASRRIHDHVKTSPTPASLIKINLTTSVPSSTKGTENIRLQPVDMHNIPKEIQAALMKVHRYMESNMMVNTTERCQFAGSLTNRTSLLIYLFAIN